MVIYSGDSAYAMLIHFGIRIFFFYLIFITSSPYLNVHVVSSATVGQAVILTASRLVVEWKKKRFNHILHNINLETARTDTEMHNCGDDKSRSLWLEIFRLVLGGLSCILCISFFSLSPSLFCALTISSSSRASPAAILRYIHCSFDFYSWSFWRFFLRLLSLAITHRNAKAFLCSFIASIFGKVKLYANFVRKIITGALATNGRISCISCEKLARISPFWWSKINFKRFDCAVRCQLIRFKLDASRLPFGITSCVSFIPVEFHLNNVRIHSLGFYSQLVAI